MSYVAACELPISCAVVYYGKVMNIWTGSPSAR